MSANAHLLSQLKKTRWVSAVPQPAARGLSLLLCAFCCQAVLQMALALGTQDLSWSH